MSIMPRATKPRLKRKLKPRIKRDGSYWMCGGLPVAPYYVDWFFGSTPSAAYLNWQKSVV